MKTIRLNEEVMVSDPCYDVGTWCQALVKNVLVGNYKVDIEVLNKTGGWGDRVSALAAFHEDALRYEFDWSKTTDDIGVDSGQAGIFDLDSYRKDNLGTPLYENIQPMFEPNANEEGDKWYTKMCTLTTGMEDFGVYESGVVSSSGYGDGSYDLWLAHNKEGKVVGFVIDFGINREGAQFPLFDFEVPATLEFDDDDEEVIGFDDEMN